MDWLCGPIAIKRLQCHYQTANVTITSSILIRPVENRTGHNISCNLISYSIQEAAAIRPSLVICVNVMQIKCISVSNILNIEKRAVNFKKKIRLFIIPL